MERSRFSDEQISFALAGREWQGGLGCLSRAGDQRCHFLHLEEEIREPRRLGSGRVAPVAGRELEAQTPGGGSDNSTST
jgi:hypothetical protein